MSYVFLTIFMHVEPDGEKRGFYVGSASVSGVQSEPEIRDSESIAGI